MKRQLEPWSVTTPVRTLQRGLGYQANRYSLEWNAALALALPQHTVRSSPNILMLVAIREHGACSISKLKFGNLITIAMFAWSYRIAAYMYSIGNQLPRSPYNARSLQKKKMLEVYNHWSQFLHAKHGKQDHMRPEIHTLYTSSPPSSWEQRKKETFTCS